MRTRMRHTTCDDNLPSCFPSYLGSSVQVAQYTSAFYFSSPRMNPSFSLSRSTPSSPRDYFIHVMRQSRPSFYQAPCSAMSKRARSSLPSALPNATALRLIGAAAQSQRRRVLGERLKHTNRGGTREEFSFLQRGRDRLHTCQISYLYTTKRENRENWN
jgi:hypothetical protein